MPRYPLTVFYDASCPICNLEMNNLKTRNTAGRLCFIDASTPEFDASPFGVSKDDMMQALHVMASDGEMFSGVPAIRFIYQAVGLGWVVAPSAWPLIQPLCKWLYRRIASHRHLLSDVFSDLIIAIAARRLARQSRACKNGTCQLPKH